MFSAGITASIARKIVPGLSSNLSLQYLGLQARNRSFTHFSSNARNDDFTKTGSEQTQEELRQKIGSSQWNALGDVGGVALGYALRHNKTVEVLDVSHCNIAEKGTMVPAPSNIVLCFLLVFMYSCRNGATSFDLNSRWTDSPSEFIGAGAVRHADREPCRNGAHPR